MALLSMIFNINGFLLLTLGFVLGYIYMTRKFTYWKKRNVKELPPWAFFGNFAQCLLMQKSITDFMSELYQIGNKKQFIGFYILDEPHLMVRDPELVKRVLIKDFENFSNRNASTGKNDVLGEANMFLQKGPKWKLIRQTVSKFFTSGKMKLAFDRMPDVAHDLEGYLMLNGLKGGSGLIDITEMCNRFATDLIGITTFGMRFNALTNPKSEFREHGRHIFRTTHRRHFEFLSMFFMPKFLKLFEIKFFTNESSSFLKNVFMEAVDEKMNNKNAKIDFLDFLIDLQENQVAMMNKEISRIKIEEFISQASVFFSAGFGTTATTLSYCLYELAKDSNIQEKLRLEIQNAISNEKSKKITYNMISTLPYLDAVVSETLRMYPTVPFLDRVSANKYSFPGTNVIIDKNTPVTIPLRALHMDPNYFPNPSVFEPERFYGLNKQNINKYTYFPFGDGPHMCIGMRLGLMVIKYGLTYIMSKYLIELCKKASAYEEFHIRSAFLASEMNIMLKMKKLK